MHYLEGFELTELTYTRLEDAQYATGGDRLRMIYQVPVCVYHLL